MTELQKWANKIGAAHQRINQAHNYMESQHKLKIPQTEEIHTCHEFDTYTYNILFMFAYGWWNEKSFAIACNKKVRANRACFVSEVTHGWLVKTYSDEEDEPDDQFEFFSTEQEEGHLVTYFEI